MLFVPYVAEDRGDGLRITVADGRYAAGTPNVRASRVVEALVTQACFHAACAATGQTSGYGLEKCYGPDGVAQNPDWPDKRKHIWDHMGKYGSPGVRLAVARGDESVQARLQAVREESDLVDRVFSWSLWRHMDPRGLPLEEIAQRPADVAGYSVPTLLAALLTRYMCRSFVSSIRTDIIDPATRYEALNALWYYLRWAVACQGGLLLYALSYLLWREAAPVLRTDPILRPLVPDLMAHSARAFGQVRVYALDGSISLPLDEYCTSATTLVPGDVLEIRQEALSAVDPAGPFKRRRVFD